MAEDTPASAPETAPASKAKVSPVAKLIAKIEEAIKKNKAENEKLSKLKGEINSTAEVCKQKKLSEEATYSIISEIYSREFPDAAPAKTGKRGRPKGSKSKGKHKGGRGVTISESVISRIKAMGKKGKTAYAISKKVGVSPKTAAKYLK